MRRVERTSAPGALTVRWLEATGASQNAKARVIDYSQTGVRIEMTKPIPVRSYVTLLAPELNKGTWAGWASVRYCERQGAKFIIGLEFAAGIRWTKPPF